MFSILPWGTTIKPLLTHSLAILTMGGVLKIDSKNTEINQSLWSRSHLDRAANEHRIASILRITRVIFVDSG